MRSQSVIRPANKVALQTKLFLTQTLFPLINVSIFFLRCFPMFYYGTFRDIIVVNYTCVIPVIQHKSNEYVQEMYQSTLGVIADRGAA